MKTVTKKCIKKTHRKDLYMPACIYVYAVAETLLSFGPSLDQVVKIRDLQTLLYLCKT